MAKRKLLKLQNELISAYADYGKVLLRYAFSRTGDIYLSENMIQQTFMKTWIYLVKQGRIDLMRAFLYHILRNLIVDQYRKPKTISLDYLIEKNMEPKIKNLESISNLIDGKAAMLLIDGLPEKYRKIMQMRYIQDLSLKEINIITGQSRNSLSVQTNRGLKN